MLQYVTVWSVYHNWNRMYFETVLFDSTVLDRNVILVADRNVILVVLLASRRWSDTIDNWIKSYVKLCHHSERSESGNSLVCAAN